MTVAQVLASLAGAPCPPPLSVTVSAVTLDVHLTVADQDGFAAWCQDLGIPASAAHPFTSVLGTLTEAATVTADGWALHVRLFGAHPAEEPSA